MPGESDPVIAAVKSQMRRLGYAVGETDTEVFDTQFEIGLRDFQQSRGLIVDGVLGMDTFHELELARHRFGDRVLRFDPVRPLRGDDVGELQHRLSRLGVYTQRIDSSFGEATHRAVVEIQHDLGIASDGVVGPATIHALSAVYRTNSRGNLWALQEMSRVSASGQSLAGRVIVIEAGTTERDFENAQFTPTNVAEERYVSGDIAHRVEGRLIALGASIVYAPVDKPRLADDLGAAAVIVVNQDYDTSPLPNGIATFYYGQGKNSNVVSPVGRSLAGLVHREIVARTRLLDCGVHARTWRSLRAANTPKVHVFAGYLSNPGDRHLIAQPQVRDAIAEGIVVAVQRLFLHEENDQDTGTLSLQGIQAMRSLL